MAEKRRFKLEKLIRDRSAEGLVAKGGVVNQRVMDPEEYKQRLKEKLLEEAQEVVEAYSIQELEEELGDVLEVLHALAAAHSITFDQIEKARMKKKEARGGFDNRVYCAFFECSAHHPGLSYFLARSEKYPEIPFSAI